MLLMNWLAKKDGHGGLALPSEFADGNVRIYGEIYNSPNFIEGEYVQTSIVTSYNNGGVRTISGNEYTLIQEALQYMNFLKAVDDGIIILKNWSVLNGKIVGTTLNGQIIQGKIIQQNISNNICTLNDGRKLFVDWLSKDPNFVPKNLHSKFLVFGTENCMPDIFCEHYNLFKSCR